MKHTNRLEPHSSAARLSDVISSLFATCLPPLFSPLVAHDTGYGLSIPARLHLTARLIDLSYFRPLPRPEARPPSHLFDCLSPRDLLSSPAAWSTRSAKSWQNAFSGRSESTKSFSSRRRGADFLIQTTWRPSPTAILDVDSCNRRQRQRPPLLCLRHLWRITE
ncbi:hypothetical protein GGR56DRAFT_534116 [Xylariaceae sp. FL0804]|nr:hypothetical protein GGR56DRAFT_534116 [Xylariaceae sp. FL0804]